MMINVGDPAPKFKLQSLDGTWTTLGEFKGKKVILYFYPKDDTPGCTNEACSFQENIAALKKKGAVILGVSADSIESHKKFAAKYGLQFPLLSDETKEVCKQYGVWKERSLYGRKFMGIERTTFIIDERGNVQNIFPRVKVDGHTQMILNALS
jgi:peroxiredoxin Q/BCP